MRAVQQARSARLTRLEPGFDHPTFGFLGHEGRVVDRLVELYGEKHVPPAVIASPTSLILDRNRQVPLPVECDEDVVVRSFQDRAERCRSDHESIRVGSFDQLELELLLRHGLRHSDEEWQRIDFLGIVPNAREKPSRFKLAARPSACRVAAR
jgi:hypothetical protein